jgi:hypothetical protein
MPRKSEFGVTITKPGFKTTTTNVTNKVAGGGGAAMAGNVLVGGLIGAGIDAGSGAMLDLVPNPLRIVHEPETAAAQAVATEASAAAPAATPTPTPTPTPAPAPETAPATLPKP